MRNNVHRHVSAPVFALGFFIVALAAVHVVVDRDPLLAEVGEASILLVFALATFFVGYRLERQSAPPEEVWRIVTVVLAGGLVVGLLSALFVVLRVYSREPTTEFAYLLFIGWSVGAGPGALVGYYYHRMRTSLSRERGLAKRLTVLQRVLRHNLRNEVTVIAGANDAARARVDDPAVRSNLELIGRHVERVADLSEHSRILTRVWQTDVSGARHVCAIVRDECDRFRREYPDVPLETDLPAVAWVEAHPDVGLAVREAPDNAGRNNDEVTVRVGLRSRSRGRGGTTITVEGTGSGIPEAELRPLRKAGEEPLEHTSGFGLWLIYWLLERSGGDLDVRSDEEAGTTVSMWLPGA